MNQEEIILSDRDFGLFQNIIYQESGIYLASIKKELLVGRLHKRLKDLNIKTFNDYYYYVSSNNDEKIKMLNCVSTNETRFFREETHFYFLEQVLLPQWRKLAHQKKLPRKIRVWSAACSTGEEAYSIGMVLLTSLPKEEGWDIEVIATDLSTDALEHAEKGVYYIAQSQHIPSHYLKAFMLRGIKNQAGKMAVSNDLRNLIKFHRINLSSEISLLYGKFDIVFCRNVLIYFDTISKSKAVSQIVDRLAPQGHLFLGHAESFHMVTHRVKNIGQNIYVHK
jgi:chemotaxis protein methyltransferase CheR